MVIGQGDIWWADLGEPIGSAPGYRRPVIIIQCDAINVSRIDTVIVVPLTSNLKWVHAPGNILLSARATNLDRDSVVNVSLIASIDKRTLIERVGKVTSRHLDQVFAGFDVMLGR